MVKCRLLRNDKLPRRPRVHRLQLDPRVRQALLWVPVEVLDPLVDPALVRHRR